MIYSLCTLQECVNTFHENIFLYILWNCIYLFYAKYIEYMEWHYSKYHPAFIAMSFNQDLNTPDFVNFWWNLPR